VKVLSAARSIGQTILAGLLALGMVVFASSVWVVLIFANLKTSPAIPWAAPVMLCVLWLMWQYLGGKGWPRSNAAERRRLLRANPVSRQAYLWTTIAGVLGLVALTGYWIVFSQLTPIHANMLLPESSRYTRLMVVAIILVASLIAPLTEEAGFRGYCQQMLERRFRPSVAIAITAIFFMVAHLNHGLAWPKLLVYFLAGVLLSVIAYVNNSILPCIPVHILADLTFFTLVWPHDGMRRLVGEGGADLWFWIHVAQAVVFTPLAILAFRRLARIAGSSGAKKAVQQAYGQDQLLPELHGC
jgi:membrane protease YdiL (CAAX protease family)